MAPLLLAYRGTRVVAVRACHVGLPMDAENHGDPVGMVAIRTNRRVDRRTDGAPISQRTACGFPTASRPGWNRYRSAPALLALCQCVGISQLSTATLVGDRRSRGPSRRSHHRRAERSASFGAALPDQQPILL